MRWAKFLILALLSLFVARTCLATTVTARLLTTGAAPTGCFVRFQLMNYGTNVPRVVGTNVIVDKTNLVANCDVAGNVSVIIQDNATISPAGTYYHVSFYQNGLLFRSGDWIITGATFDLNTAVPMTTVPVVSPPTGDTTYPRLDGGNLNLVGPGWELPVRLADTFAGADAGAKIAACWAAMPAGGTCDARKLLGAQTISAQLDLNKPGTLLLGDATYTLPPVTGGGTETTGGGGIKVSSNGVHVIGTGNTILQATRDWANGTWYAIWAAGVDGFEARG